jgi:hypothetical protein
MKYKVHRLDVTEKFTQALLEEFLNSLNGEIVAVIPNVTPTWTVLGEGASVNFLLIIEKLV